MLHTATKENKQTKNLFNNEGFKLQGFLVLLVCCLLHTPPQSSSQKQNKKTHFSCNKTFHFEVLTTGGERLPVSSDFTVENSPSEMAIFVTLVTSVLSFLSLVSAGHNGDFNFHIGQTEKKKEEEQKPHKSDKETQNQTKTSHSKKAVGGRAFTSKSNLLNLHCINFIFTNSASHKQNKLAQFGTQCFCRKPVPGSATSKQTPTPLPALRRTDALQRILLVH